MKQFIIEWCINMAIALAFLGYIGVVMLGIYLLNDNTLKGFIYICRFMDFICNCNHSNLIHKVS